MTITNLQYPSSKQRKFLVSWVAAVGLTIVGCGDSHGADADGTDEGDKSSEMSPSTSGKDEGEGDGKDVVTIGDSWMNLNNMVGIQQSLEKASSRDYRNYGVPGTKLLDEVIPNQYEMAKKDGAIKTVIMTAGGNDVLQDLVLLGFECPDASFDTSTACKKRIDDVAARLEKLWAEMATDGVHDVVIVGYTNTALGGGYKKVTAYSNEKIQPICDAVPTPLRCSTLDADMVAPGIMLRDGIHPVDADYDRIGQALWELMEEKGMRR